jgi:hypothetical protein
VVACREIERQRDQGDPDGEHRKSVAFAGVVCKVN